MRLGSSLRVDRQIKALKEQLKLAIEKKTYEQAAVLRDKIKELEKKASRRVGVGKYD